ncbi:sporulation protein YunB [Virgibacillus profundi]|uniref:Sporulation protein YunB n=1 Tax=Virgibacillus profundi TaxID=2024555 RepID=A0A2A2IAI1_9BACI|nr:sporulation protein YunB [Virgibacillus profundi]PAV28729.1 sporulation protein YunB [Virgibacillus profundi]PXY52897.1 sporulation protein YunB [Virgibacillus profundi]
MLRQRKKFGTNRTSPPGKNILVITMILFAVFIGLSIWIIDRGIEPTLMEIAEAKTDEFATRAINSAVRFAENYDFEDIANITYNNNGDPAIYNWNSAMISEINRVATDRVEEFFLNMNRGDPLVFDNPLQETPDYSDGAEDLAKVDPTIVEIPLGQVTGNSVLANLGPKVPVNLEFVGNVRTNIYQETKEWGINSSWVSLYLYVEVDVQVVIPFTTEVTKVHTEIYMDGGAIMADVPEFYGGSNPNIAIPKEDIEKDLQDE